MFTKSTKVLNLQPISHYTELVFCLLP